MKILLGVLAGSKDSLSLVRVHEVNEFLSIHVFKSLGSE